MKAVNGFKHCAKCKNLKPVIEFNRDKSTCDGLQYTCKECQKERFKRYLQQHREALKGKHKKYNQVYYQKNKSRIITQTRRYGKEHKKERNTRLRLKYRSNEQFRVLVLARTSRWVFKNPDKRRKVGRDYARKYHPPSYSTIRFFQTLSAIQTIKNEIADENKANTSPA